MLPRRIKSTLTALLGLLVFAAPAQAQTVTGPVDSASEEHITVDGTRFIVDGETVIQPSPASPGHTLDYKVAYLEDSWKVRVTGTGRLAERIVILPYQSEGPEGGRAR
jgi:hypothetical protein